MVYVTHGNTRHGLCYFRLTQALKDLEAHKAQSKGAMPMALKHRYDALVYLA